jgi:hypothetical protein
MAAKQPTPQTMDPDEERKLRLFLERAAPIVLESRVLDKEKWGQLVTLAEKLQMSDGQLRATVEDLRQRGVIERVELQPIKPAAKPPPLPKRPTDAGPASSSQPKDGSSADQDTTPITPPAREKTFSLNSPPPPPPASIAPPPAPATPQANHGQSDPGTLNDLCEQLSQRAAAIIAEQRGLTPKTHSLIASAAEDLGLSDRDVTAVIRSLQQGVGKPQEPATDDANHRQRWKEEGKPEPPLHEAPVKPHEIFSAFVAKSLDKLAVGHVSSDLEAGLVAHGTKVLKLSRIYATQLVRDVSHTKDLLLETDTRGQSQGEDESTNDDPRLRVFLERATPILAQNRGLNARSRVLLGAMAEEVGLAADEVDAAVAMLETKPAETDGLDSELRQRLAPFRRYAAEMLEQLPHKILTGRVHTMIVERGEERFGIDSEMARTVLRELAAERQIQIISEEEATRHIEGLVEEQLGDAFRLQTDVKQRIQKEGGQWGLSEEQIEQIIKKRTRRNYRKRRSEQNLSNAALVAAFIAVLLVVAFLGWAMFGSPITPSEPGPVVIADPIDPATPVNNTDDSWWSVELVLAIHHVSAEFPLLGPRMKDIASRNVEHRANAYDAIIRHAFDNTNDDAERAKLLNVISRAYVDEPDAATAAKIRQSLVRVIPGPEDRLSHRADDYPRIFEAMRGAVAALHAAADNDGRADDMARAIGKVVGTTIDRDQPLGKLERQCLGALAERLFRLMTTAAASRPADTLPLHRVISKEAGRYLDQPRIETLNSDFLAACLPTSADSWREFQGLIDDTVDNRDPLIVANMINVYETTADASLRSHLESRLLRRANLTPKAEEARAIADEIRQALGIREAATAEGRALDFVQIATRELERTSTEKDERTRAADRATRLNWVATLGCALAQSESGLAMFDQMVKKKPSSLRDTPSDVGPLLSTFGRTDWDALARIDSSIGRLKNAGAVNRIDRIENIARDADRVRDLKPIQARVLATYLLTKKSIEEHERVLEHLPKFGGWSHLYLALADMADGIFVATLDRFQMEELLSRLLGEEITLGDAEAVRGLLLRRAYRESAPQESSVSGPQLIDRASEMMLDQYARQANLLGVPLPSYADSKNPADTLTAIIEHYSTRLADADAGTEAARLRGEIPHQLAAIEYIATNRLHQTVLLERIWLQLLATDLKRQSPSTSDGTDRIIRELRQADRTAGNSLVQLQASQAAIVRLWMLWNRP